MSSFDLTLQPATDPTAIYRHRDGLYAVDLLTAALVHLDFFSRLAAQPAELAGICRTLGTMERPTDVMLTLFAAMGLIESRNGVFHVTDLAREHLIGGSPWNLAPYYGSLKDRPVSLDFLRVLSTGKPANWGGQKDQLDWHKAMETEPFARQFTAAMDCRGVFLGQALARKLDLRGHARLLDIGGGSGIYACSLAAHHPHLRAVVFDQPPVDRIAARLIAERGFAGRVDVQAGDMFQGLPGGCDAHLFSNVLHDWDVPEVRRLLAHSFNALPAGGLLIIHDAHLNAEKNGPLPVAAYSTILMHSTQGRCYSVAEMESWLTETGFQNVTFQPTAADRSVITARK